jgi:hypothetical protein
VGVEVVDEEGEGRVALALQRQQVQRPVGESGRLAAARRIAVDAEIVEAAGEPGRAGLHRHHAVDGGTDIAGVVQALGQHRHIRPQLAGAGMGEDSMVQRVDAGEQGREGGMGGNVRRLVVGKAGAFGRQPVDVRAGRVGVAVAGEVVRSQRIGGDDNDVVARVPGGHVAPPSPICQAHAAAA